MSETNDGGFAERGNKVGTAGGLAQPGGPNTSSGGTGNNGSNKSGASKSSKSAGTNLAVTKKKSNVVSTYGELLPGVRAPVVPGYGYTNRKNQTLGDIQAQNVLGNQAAMGQNPGSSQGGSTGTVTNPLKKQVVWNPVKKQYVPVPQPAPILPQNYNFANPYTNYAQPIPGPLGPWLGDPVPEEATVLPQNYGFQNPTGAIGVAPLPTGNTSTATKTNLDPAWNGPQQEQVTQQPGGGHNARQGGYAGGGPNLGLQFGGEAQPGQTYTVGENGPETLMMGQNGGGQVIPHNPMDRLGSMSPQMMQQFYQLMQQHQQQQRPPMPPQQMPQRPPMQPPQQPATPTLYGSGMAPQQQQPPQPRPMGQPQMGIAGLSRPPQPNQGFGWGGNGLGQRGIMPQLAGQNRMG